MNVGQKVLCTHSFWPSTSDNISMWRFQSKYEKVVIHMILIEFYLLTVSYSFYNLPFLILEDETLKLEWLVPSAIKNVA